MKHLLNNLSEGEKKDILAKYDGTLQVKTDKFIKLLESKLGDVKPYSSNKEKLIKEETGGGKIYTAAEMAKDPDWGLKFPCIKNQIGARRIYKLQGTTPSVYVLPTSDNGKKVEDKIYSNGRYFSTWSDTKENYTLYWYCDPSNPEILDIDNDKIPSEAIEMGLAITQQAPSSSNTDKIYSTDDKDPYEYKLINCKWHAIKGPKDRYLKDWKPVPEGAVSILDGRYPDAKKDANCSTSSEANNLHDKTGLSDERWKKLGLNCITQQLTRQIRKEDSTVQYYDKKNDTIYFDNGKCFTGRKENTYTIRGNASCDDNMPNCTPV